MVVPHRDVELPCIDGAWNGSGERQQNVSHAAIYIGKQNTTSPTGAVDVEEIERLFDLFLLLRRQPLPPDFVCPVAGGVGRRIGGLVVRAHLHHPLNIQFSAMLFSFLFTVLLPI